MREITYLAVFEPSETGYAVYFPDLNGCISYGDDLENAQQMAKEALGLHIYGLEKDGDIIPEPSKTVKIESMTNEGYIILPVTIYPDTEDRIILQSKLHEVITQMKRKIQKLCKPND